MIIKTCLLVTDDYDDHQAFSEAASEISEGAIVLIILESQKALHLLKTKSNFFDYIFLDLLMPDIRINSFLKVIQQEANATGTIIVYGDEGSFTKIENPAELIYFKKDYKYSELRDFLKKFFDPSSELYQ